jgi:3-deoxy-manno-octulosonate cytidylyltransferase (CMP-KDO synthetase)
MDSTKKVFVIGVIPARRGSTRLPLKMVAPLHGKPLISWTLNNTLTFPILDDVFVATDCKDIMSLVSPKGILTSSEHKSGTDRVAEAVSSLDLEDDSIIVNIQGDEPLLESDIVKKLVEALLESPETPMATAVTSLKNEEDAKKNSIVKCVTDLNGFALYFSRALIPQGKEFDTKRAYLRHLGIYAFRLSFLKKFAALKATPLQIAEDLEQLKALENGYKIKTVYVETESIGVDTLEDLKKVEERLCNPNTFSQQVESAPH